MTAVQLPDSPAVAAARITFRQPVSPTGFIDAAWWPRTTDLTAELPEVLTGLWSVGREIFRISYSLDVWDRAPRRLWVHGRQVRLGGFTTIDPLTAVFSDARGKDHIDALVIPPATDPDIAHRAMTIASEAGDPCRAAEIMDRAASS
jgi:Family of unknown function (DUF5994)